MATTNRSKTTSRLPEIRIDVKGSIRSLIVAQRCVKCGYVTTYRGSRKEFEKAGVSAALLDQPTLRTPFSFLCGDQSAALSRAGDAYELEIHWDNNGPWYHSAEHPALGEVARMILVNAGYWLRGRSSFDDPERGMVQTDALLNNSAVEYNEPRDRKYRFDPDDLRRLEAKLNDLFISVHNASITLVEPPVALKRRRRRAPSAKVRAKHAEDAKADAPLQKLIASAMGKATRKAAPKRPSAGEGHDQ